MNFMALSCAETHTSLLRTTRTHYFWVLYSPNGVGGWSYSITRSRTLHSQHIQIGEFNLSYLSHSLSIKSINAPLGWFEGWSGGSAERVFKSAGIHDTSRGSQVLCEGLRGPLNASELKFNTLISQGHSLGIDQVLARTINLLPKEVN